MYKFFSIISQFDTQIRIEFAVVRGSIQTSKLSISNRNLLDPQAG
jgi:hypothetical protein